MKQDWTHLFAHRAAGMRESDVRVLFSMVNELDASGGKKVISLAGGMPYVEGLNREEIIHVQERIINDRAHTALQYGSGQGNITLRNTVVDLMRMESINVNPEDIIITNGSQNGLDLISKLFLDRGDVVLAESPTYVGAISVFSSYQADVEHVASDKDGLLPHALEEKITELRKIGKTIKLLYLVPNYNNPSGSLMTLARRHQILEIAVRNGILILEDDPYGLLYFDSPPPASLISIAGLENIIYLGSFSKILAPGFRMGWIAAPESLKQQLVVANEAAVLNPSEFSQAFVSEYINHVNWENHLSEIRRMYATRKQAMVDALETYLPNMSFTEPEGGFFLWADLEPHINCKDLLLDAVKEGVVFTPGTAFYANGNGINNIRLSFSYPTPENITEGVRRISLAIAKSAHR